MLTGLLLQDVLFFFCFFPLTKSTYKKSRGGISSDAGSGSIMFWDQINGYFEFQHVGVLWLETILLRRNHLNMTVQSHGLIRPIWVITPDLPFSRLLNKPSKKKLHMFTLWALTVSARKAYTIFTAFGRLPSKAQLINHLVSL